MCVLLRSYKKGEADVIAVVCVCRYDEVSFLVYLISVRNELGSWKGA